MDERWREEHRPPVHHTRPGEIIVGLAPKPQHGLERTRRPSALQGIETPAPRQPGARIEWQAMAAAGAVYPDLGGVRHGWEGKPRARRAAVAFRVLAETARGRGARAATPSQDALP